MSNSFTSACDRENSVSKQFGRASKFDRQPPWGEVNSGRQSVEGEGGKLRRRGKLNAQQGEGLPGLAEEVRHVPLLRFDFRQFLVGLYREKDRKRAGRKGRGFGTVVPRRKRTARETGSFSRRIAHDKPSYRRLFVLCSLFGGNTLILNKFGKAVDRSSEQ